MPGHYEDEPKKGSRKTKRKLKKAVKKIAKHVRGMGEVAEEKSQSTLANKALGWAEMARKKDAYSKTEEKYKSKSKGHRDAEVDGELWDVKEKRKVKAKGGKSVKVKKGKGTGYANPIKSYKDKTVKKDGVVTKSKSKTKYRTPKAVERRTRRATR